MNICDFHTGEEAEIIDVTGPSMQRQRLLELGFIKGCRVRIQSVSSFQGPVILKVSGGTFALRRDEAQWIEVKRI